MEFHEIISAIIHNFKRGVQGFFIDTDFGTLAIEQLTEDYDEMSPVMVTRWLDAPCTNLTIANRHASADIWVGIGNAHLRHYPMRVHAIEAMVKVMFMVMVGAIPDEDIIDAGVSLYLSEAEHKKPSMNLMLDEFLRMNIDIFPRQCSSVQNLAEKMIRNRVDASQRVISVSQELLRLRGIHKYAYRFQEDYYIDLFGVLLYAIQRNPALTVSIGRDRFYGIIFHDEYKIFGNPDFMV